MAIGIRFSTVSLIMAAFLLIQLITLSSCSRDLRAGNHWINGMQLRSEHRYDDAIREFNIAINIYPEYDMNYVARGETYYIKKEYDKAIGDFNIAIALNPKRDLAYSHRGDAYIGRKEYDKAISDFDRAIELDPNLEIA